MDPGFTCISDSKTIPTSDVVNLVHEKDENRFSVVTLDRNIKFGLLDIKLTSRYLVTERDSPTCYEQLMNRYSLAAKK